MTETPKKHRNSDNKRQYDKKRTNFVKPGTDHRSPDRKPKKPAVSARRAAYDSLIRCGRDGKYSNIEIDSVLKKTGLEGAERGFFTTLVYGVIERAVTLDYALSLVSDKSPEKLDPEVRTILRLALYQIIFLDRVPESAAVNEAVVLAKDVMFSSATFVNAVLRGYLRRFGKGTAGLFSEISRIEDANERLSVRYSMSVDVISLLGEYAGDTLVSLLDSLEKQPFPALRVNTLKISRDEMLERLNFGGDHARISTVSPFGLKLKNHNITPEISELISDGYVYIQDEASQIAVACAAPAAGETVLDVCACPGGKSFSAAILMENRGQVKSFDLHRNKLSLIEKGAEKMGISIISTAEKNGAEFDPSLENSADLVIVDAPCSGLGVIAKKPEIRYKKREDISRLPEIQRAILENSARYVKPGGRLFYSTCTLNIHENDEIADSFAAEHPEFERMTFGTGEIQSRDGKITLRPDVHGTDGFFIAGFRRTK